MLSGRPFGLSSAARTGRRSASPPCGERALRSRSLSRNSAASLFAALSNTGSAPAVTLTACVVEQFGAQAQRIEPCAESKLSFTGRCTITRIAVNATMTSALNAPTTQASARTRRDRLPVGSKKTGLMIMGGRAMMGQWDAAFGPRARRFTLVAALHASATTPHPMAKHDGAIMATALARAAGRKRTRRHSRWGQ
jgi:hypothetical protein